MLLTQRNNRLGGAAPNHSGRKSVLKKQYEQDVTGHNNVFGGRCVVLQVHFCRQQHSTTTMPRRCMTLEMWMCADVMRRQADA